jgi:dCTP deaminase
MSWGVLSPRHIRKVAPLHPLHERSVVNGMSAGMSCAGYDIRIADDVTLWPKGHALAYSVERFDMPDHVIGILTNKSTLARRFVHQPFTVLEPGWRGNLTLELVNHSWRFVRLRSGDPVAQILFLTMTEATDRPYGAGKYQNQPARPVGAILEAA